jgi:carbamoylphosphate synthase small subunit
VINVDSLRLHTIQSYESQLIQLTDLLIGVIGYANKEIKSSAAKTELVDYTQSQVKVSLVRSSALFNKKFNVFVWSPR